MHILRWFIATDSNILDDFTLIYLSISFPS